MARKQVSFTRIAQRYARIVFSLSSSVGDTELMRTQIGALVDAYAASDEVRVVCSSPVIDRASKIAAMRALARHMNVLPLIESLLVAMAENNRLAALPFLGDAFEACVREAAGVAQIEITSAFPLDDANVQEIATHIGREMGVRAVAKLRVDPSLIGGVVVRYGSLQWDASVKGKLALAAQTMYRVGT
ncbi:MAG: ATP synthase F1 subunit delta [Alphaproteobacteria bacterium]|nr:MAG: ATP synthase F1 subunit delta [Alphaproteobacteria bacterium]